MNARQHFEGLRERARDAERCRRQLDIFESSALKSAGRAAHADILRRRLESDERAIEDARGFIFGTDGTGGLCPEIGARACDALWLRYVLDAPWRAVAASINLCWSQSQVVVREALNAIDARGLLAGIEKS